MLESEGLCASEVLRSAPRGAAYNEVHSKCFYTSALSMRNKVNEPDVLAQSQNYHIISISETWWDESCDWCVAIMATGSSGGTGRAGEEVGWHCI